MTVTLLILCAVLLILVVALILTVMVGIKVYKLLLVADSNRKFVEVRLKGREKPYFGWLRTNEIAMARRVDTNEWYITVNGVGDDKCLAYKGDIISIDIITSVPEILKKGWKLIDTIQS